jgi:hypothetical protein
MEGGSGAGWMEYLKRFAGSQGGMGERVGAAVGSDNAASIGQMYDQLMTPPASQPLLAPPTLPAQPAQAIQFGPAGGMDPQMMAMLMRVLKQGRA